MSKILKDNLRLRIERSARAVRRERPRFVTHRQKAEAPCVTNLGDALFHASQVQA